MQLETINVPAGAYIGWAPNPGQVVKGYVTEYQIAGATDFAGAACPLLSIELTEAAYSVNKDLQRTDFGAGEQINITCGQANLKRNVQAANLLPGDYIELTYKETTKTANGTVKIFALGVARQARPVANAPHTVTPPAPAAAPGTVASRGTLPPF